jgi:hypothetical protein
LHIIILRITACRPGCVALTPESEGAEQQEYARSNRS